ncbi:MAG: hypothetical protein CMO55_06650 [Verrucomicrobiales bacterium]|nr:hypothetical protein [Verrucomicrobiales bacterium]
MRALDLPSDFPTSKECQELFRAWIDRGKISISICHDLPSDWRIPEESWAMLLSDIFHHVIEGIVAATTHPREDVLHRIFHAFEIAVKSKRECRAGITKEFTDSFRELPTPDIVVMRLPWKWLGFLSLRDR